MSAKRSTQTVVKVGSINNQTSTQSQLEIRAARFGLSTGSSSTTKTKSTIPLTSSTSRPVRTTPYAKPVMLKVDSEKAAARAKRFADVAPDAKVKITNNSGATVAVNASTAEKLAARAKRFADVKVTKA